MKRNLVCLTMAAVMSLGISAFAFAQSVTATPNNASVAVDGEAIEIGAYNIGGYNYFKLRDVAAALNGTASNFEVGYDDAAKCISLTTGKAYTSAGGELGAKPEAANTASVSSQKIMLNGADVTMQAYVIDGYNYFQLRELGTNLGFEVNWDDTAKAINMVTKEADAVAETPVVETPAAELTAAEKLQSAVDEIEDNGEVVLSGSYVGEVGDTIVIDKGIKFVSNDGAVIENITLEINTPEPIWVEGITFNGSGKDDHAIVIKNAGGKSAIKDCTIKNYISDAVVIEKMEANTLFGIVYNEFSEYGLEEEKVDAAILLNATEKNEVSFEIVGNVFKLSKNIDDEATMDVALATNTTITDGAEVFSATKVLFADNEITKGNNFKSNVDAYSDLSRDLFEVH